MGEHGPLSRCLVEGRLARAGTAPLGSGPAECQWRSRVLSASERVPDANSLDLNAIWETDWENTLLAAAMKNVRPKLDPQKYQLFDFYVNKDWAPEKVAQTFKVTVNQVYLAKSRITEMLKEEVSRLENEVT